MRPTGIFTSLQCRIDTINRIHDVNLRFYRWTSLYKLPTGTWDFAEIPLWKKERLWDNCISIVVYDRVMAYIHDRSNYDQALALTLTLVITPWIITVKEGKLTLNSRRDESDKIVGRLSSTKTRLHRGEALTWIVDVHKIVQIWANNIIQEVII